MTEAVHGGALQGPAEGDALGSVSAFEDANPGGTQDSVTSLTPASDDMVADEPSGRKRPSELSDRWSVHQSKVSFPGAPPALLVERVTTVITVYARLRKESVHLMVVK